jgi:uncharacterized membrane protein
MLSDAFVLVLLFNRAKVENESVSNRVIFVSKSVFNSLLLFSGFQLVVELFSFVPTFDSLLSLFYSILNLLLFLFYSTSNLLLSLFYSTFNSSVANSASAVCSCFVVSGFLANRNRFVLN